MSVRLNPYLNFRDTARAAMTFYQSVFGGELKMSTFKDGGMPSGPDDEDLIMHAELDGLDGLALMASDCPPGMEYRPGNNISISLSGDDEATLRRYWEKLSSGGQTMMPLETAPWGDTFGMCTDRFGIQWLVNISAGRA